MGRVRTHARYADSVGQFAVWIYSDRVNQPTILQGTMTQRPEWLVNIIDAAIVGGWLTRVPKPPPDQVVWFYMDEDKHLIEFDSV